MRKSLAEALAPLRGRPAAILGSALAVACGLILMTGPLSDAFEAQGEIVRGRELLARTRAATAQTTLPAPLWAEDQDALAVAFRARLEALAAGRAVVLDDVRAEPDPARPSAPRLIAVARGTTEGVHGMLLALETQAPFLVIETADLTIASMADARRDRPTVMRVAFAARGVIAPPKPGTGAANAGARER